MNLLQLSRIDTTKDENRLSASSFKAKRMTSRSQHNIISPGGLSICEPRLKEETAYWWAIGGSI